MVSPEKCSWGLPWWSRGKESALQCGRCQFNPWSRKIPPATAQLILRAAAEAHTPWSPCATVREATAMRGPRPTTREQPPTWQTARMQQ